MKTRTFTALTDLRSIRGISNIRVSVDRVPVINDAPPPECDTPDRAASALTQFIDASALSWETEAFYVLMLSTRRRLIGIHVGATGTLDTILVHPREVFRAAIIANASAIVLAHNHPSGDPTPSEGDIRVTRELFRAGQLLKIEVLDHVIVANPALRIPGTRAHSSLRELGYFYA